MANLVKCPTCGRAGSERIGIESADVIAAVSRAVITDCRTGEPLKVALTLATTPCPSPFHDAADRAPSLRREALEAARNVMCFCCRQEHAMAGPRTNECGAACRAQEIRALLAKETK